MDRPMTYGEKVLARAEFRAARKRRAITMLPGLAVVLWSLADLVAARHHRLVVEGAGFFAHVVDHVQPIVWTLLLVAVPYLVAVKPKPKRSGAVLALFTGPVLTPLLFGSGGWRLWQIGVLAALVLYIESGDGVRVRRAAAPAEPEMVETYAEPAVDEPDWTPAPPVSVQEISSASFQRRSSS